MDFDKMFDMMTPRTREKTVKIKRKDGTMITNIKLEFELSNKVAYTQEELDIEIGDTVLTRKPNGRNKKQIIQDIGHIETGVSTEDMFIEHGKQTLKLYLD